MMIKKYLMHATVLFLTFSLLAINIFASDIRNGEYIQVGISLILLTIFNALLLIYKNKLETTNRELVGFKRAVENSSNTIIITDIHKNIKYVNKAFTKTTGYLSKDIIGKQPDILKSQLNSDELYNDLNEAICNGKTWHGELINLDKEGMLIYEETTITPIFENEKIVEFLVIKKNITKQKIAQEKIKEQDKILAEQSKMAFMGEMLENIAHQWRQPLNVISTAATGILIQKEYGLVNDAKEIKTLTNINQSAQYLSQIINDFQSFYQEKELNTSFSTKEIYSKTLQLIGKRFENGNIELIENISDLTLYGSNSKFTQILMNLISNAIDALNNKQSDKKFIFITLLKENNSAVFTIKDSGGGVDENIIDRIFEPYFTTKHKAQGTGIGLYMSMKIVKDHMNGEINVKNETYSHAGYDYKGAVFKIILPLDRRVS